MTPAPLVRWGFLGAGSVATLALGPAVHAADGARLQAVAARDPRRARALQPAGATYDDYQALLADPEVDVVYIALANDDHLPWALAALSAGKHVLCEKPMGLDAGQVAQIARAAAVASRWAIEATWYRWHPRAARTQQLIRDGAVGEPTALASAFCFGNVPDGNYRLDPTRGGGAWLDVGCYAVSAAHLLLGDELTVESAYVRNGVSGVDLETSATLRTPGGAVAEVLASMDAPEHQDLTVHGAAASLTWSAPQLTSWREPATLVITAPGVEPIVEEFAAVDAYRLMVEQVSACVRGDSEPVVSAAESLRVARTMDAVVARRKVIA